MKIFVLVALLTGLLILRLNPAGAQVAYLLFAPQVVRAPLPTPTLTLVPTATLLPEPTGTPTPVPPTPTRTPTPRPSGCHPSYPTVCIPPPPPDLNCGDIPYRNFVVLRPDVHRFDGDGDGVGCET
jgi:hypothetical protein